MRVDEGMKFGRWTVIAPAKGLWITKVLCLCDCGVERKVRYDHLAYGHSVSCGCFNREVSAKRRRTHGRGSAKHPDATYKIWSGIKTRCLNDHCKSYARYGGLLCKRWMRFENFLADMGERPGPGWSIDRIENSRGYEPGNCRWATAIEQQNNRSDNHRLSLNGEHRTLAEWSQITNIGHSTILRRLGLGWSTERALLTQPLRARKDI